MAFLNNRLISLIFSMIVLASCLSFFVGFRYLPFEGSVSISTPSADEWKIAVNKDPSHAKQQQQTQNATKIAHVISLITCKKSSRVKGFLDALLILRHSIHQNSVHATNDNNNNNKKRSKYSYQMFAIVHENGGCVEHVPILQRMGYIPLIRPTPINISAIQNNDWYRNHVEGENCCGSAEFIKLYAYTLIDYPVVVHWDLDVAVLQPMDELFDAIIYDKDSAQGQTARRQLQVQRRQKQLPDRIDAFFTRDVTSAAPWEKVQAVQGGFVVVRPSMEHFELYRTFILDANYTPGRGPGSGWGGLGYGGFQGAMAYQGVLAYFYDKLVPGVAVELDVCRWNQVVADVIWRGPSGMEHNGQCRQYPADGMNFEQNTPENEQCEDCRILPIEETRTVHYTACKKPWECTLPYPRKPGRAMKHHEYRLRELTNVTTCSLLFRKYFGMRMELEQLIEASTGQPAFERTGSYHPEYFLGYCKRGGSYLSMEELPPTFDMKMIYGF